MIIRVVAAMGECEHSIAGNPMAAENAVEETRSRSYGRKRSLTDEQCREAFEAVGHGEPWSKLATRYGVHPRTLKRSVAEVCGTVPEAGV